MNTSTASNSAQKKFQTKSEENQRRRLENDPCFEEGQVSLDCQTNYFDSCAKEIENLKTCRTFWHNVKKDRKAKEIYPILPPIEERQEIKKQFMQRTKTQIEKRRAEINKSSQSN